MESQDEQSLLSIDSKLAIEALEIYWLVLDLSNHLFLIDTEYQCSAKGPSELNDRVEVT